MALEEAVGAVPEEPQAAAPEPAGSGVADEATVEGERSAAAVTYPIAPGYQVNVRSAPNTGSRVVRVLAVNSRVPIRCQTLGERVSGPYGTSSIWNNIASGQYVSDAYVLTGSDGFVTGRCA